jgi:3-deoxy-D-manno-octulosonic-acid transferase
MYRAVAPLLGAVAPAARAFASSEERALWDERLGRGALDSGVDAWIHAASLGEALGVGPLVRELDSSQPGARIHLTSMTRAGRQRLTQIRPEARLAPIDAPQIVGRFLAALRPARLFLVETELWPHWLLGASARRLPVAVVSARLSSRSVAKYRRLGRGLRRLVGDLDAVLCQSDEDRDRWLSLGAPPARCAVTGNLKNDALPLPVADRHGAREALGFDPERPLIVFGSLRPGEVRVLARAWRELPAPLKARWQVAAIPRHRHAAARLEAEAAESGQSLARGGAPVGDAWRWDERTGVLQSYYAAAEVAVVGGTLGPYGGHNPLEPAACGAAVLVGPHHESQAQAVAALLARDAIGVTAPAELARALRSLVEDPVLRAARAEAARAVVDAGRGAARRTVERLVEWGLWPAH